LLLSYVSFVIELQFANFYCELESSWNVMAQDDAREGKWRGNWRMGWVASTLHTTSEHGVSSITAADAQISAASSRLNWRSCRLKWTRPFRRKTKSGFCAYAITLQMLSTICHLCYWLQISKHASYLYVFIRLCHHRIFVFKWNFVSYNLGGRWWGGEGPNPKHPLNSDIDGPTAHHHNAMQLSTAMDVTWSPLFHAHSVGPTETGRQGFDSLQTG
jgi:hypothetical protein